MPSFSSDHGPDPEALRALQAETERSLWERLDQLRTEAAALTLESPAQAFNTTLEAIGELRERVRRHQRMGRLVRGASRALQRALDDLGRAVGQQRNERGRQRAEQREAAAAHAMALRGAVQEFVAAVETYDPFERGREKADAVRAARQRVQELLDAGADRGKAREALARFEEACRLLAAKHRQRDAAAQEAEARVEGLILGLRMVLAETTPDSPREQVALATTARRKVVDAMRSLPLSRDARARLQAAFEPLHQRHAEILRLRHEAYLERKARREERERQARERRAAEEQARTRYEAKLLHYAALYCSRVYAYDPAEAPKGEAAEVRHVRRLFDLLLREGGGRPARVRRIVAAVHAAAADFQARLEERARLFGYEGRTAEDTDAVEAAPPVESSAVPEVPEGSAHVGDGGDEAPPVDVGSRP